MYDDLTLVLQGPLHRDSLQHIEEYASYGTLVISHWSDDDLSLLEEFDVRKFANRIICQPTPDANKVADRGYIRGNYCGTGQPSTFYWSIVSTFNGLCNAHTPHTLKLRSDEYIGNLQPMIDKFMEDTEKIVMSNIYAMNYAECHMGDHFFIGKTDYLYRGYQHIYLVYNGLKPPAVNFNHCEWDNNFPETVLCKTLLFGMGKPPLHSAFAEHFDMVHISEMTPYVIKNNHSRPDIYESEKGGICELGVKTMEELRAIRKYG